MKNLKYIKKSQEVCLGELKDTGLRVTETDKHGAYLYCDCAQCFCLRGNK